jgi:hypothetical protein
VVIPELAVLHADELTRVELSLVPVLENEPIDRPVEYRDAQLERVITLRVRADLLLPLTGHNDSITFLHDVQLALKHLIVGDQPFDVGTVHVRADDSETHGPQFRRNSFSLQDVPSNIVRAEW